MNLNKLQKLVEAINTYYAFALLVYAAILYATSNSLIFWWVLILATPLLIGWTGYLIHSYFIQRNYIHGFKVISDTMTYEILGKDKYKLRYKTQLKAAFNYLFVYPIAYQWSGRGKENIPEITGDRLQLLAPINPISPYKVTGSSIGEWHYWFAAFNPPVSKGEITEVNYSQTFTDSEHSAKPYLFYIVRTPMKKLELNVKFSNLDLPASVSCGYFKPSDPRRAIKSSGVVFQADKGWATWVIERPKRGYCYRIDWQKQKIYF
jgi:hypothetical protein